MTYYHDIITEKSWGKLQELRRRYHFILIGGWAVFLYSRGLKSRDIDFICDYEELGKLKRDYDLSKNERLKKYEIHAGEFDIDIYVPFFSDLGIPVEELMQYAVVREGFSVLIPETLMILKQKAFFDRKGSSKGEKDRIDILALCATEFDVEKYTGLAKKYGLHEFPHALKTLIGETRSVPELSIKDHAFAKLKKKILGNL